MRKRCRTRCTNQSTNQEKTRELKVSRMVAHFAYIQPDTATWREWSFRLISQRKANQMLADGEVEPVTRRDTDGEVRVVGYRALKPTSWERPSPCTLTFGTMLAVGNQDAGEKLTPGERRHILKFKVWPLIGDTKAVAVRPRISERDRLLAEKLLQRPDALLGQLAA